MNRTTAAALLSLAAPALRAQDAPADQVLRLERAAAEVSARTTFAAALRPLADSATVYLHAGAPVVTGEAMHALTAGADSLLVEWQAEYVEVAADTTLAFTWGVATSRPRRGGAGRFGRYVAAWRRTADGWRLAALVFSGVLPPAAGPPPRAALPPLDQRAPPGRFVAADLAFAALAGRSGSSRAFERFAADDAVTFSGSGLLNRGPRAIGRWLAGDDASWRWEPVAAGASRDGAAGWTVGESAITAHSGATAGQTFYGKYLTLWRRDGGSAKYIADAGNARPAP